MSLYIKNNGSWVPPQVYVKHNNVWKEPTEIYVRQNGIWQLNYKSVTISANTSNVNLQTLMGNPTQAITAIVNINSNVQITSTSTSTPAFDTTGIPSGSILYLIVGSGAYIVGKGGTGGARVSGRGDQGTAKPGTAGGTALKTRIATYIINNGTIGGGGGGGGGGSRTNTGGQAYDDYTGAGGGGAGFGAGGAGIGQCSTGGSPGTLTAGGAGIQWCSNGGSSEQQGGSYGGAGGSLGQAGAHGLPDPGTDNTNVGGAAGNAIDGLSYITKKTTGSILGPQVN